MVVVDFFATWCGPCVMISPKLEIMSKEEKYKDSVVFVKVSMKDEGGDAMGLEREGEVKGMGREGMLYYRKIIILLIHSTNNK